MNTNKHENLVSYTQFEESPKKKFSEWENILVGSDIHTIRNQIYEMVFDSAIFQCINESRKYAEKDDKGKDKRNEMLHSFINQSFFKTQLLSIRRLTDKDFGRIKKGKQYTVYSLYNLIEDIKNNNALLTRGNILAFHDLPYDYEKAMAEFKNDTGCTTGRVIVPLPIAYSEYIHRCIDSIVGITSDRRNRDDRVLNEDSFKYFDDWLDINQELYDYVNKYYGFKRNDREAKRILGKI